MELIIDAQRLFNRLKYGPSLSSTEDFLVEATKPFREGEEWKNNRSYIQDSQEAIVKSDAIGLPFPFGHSELICTRIGNLYNALFNSHLNSSNYKRTREVIQRIAKNIDVADYGKVCATSDNFFYVVDSNNNPIIAVGINKEFYYQISIGKSGTEERDFSSFEGFKEDMTLLGNLINRVVNIGLDSAVELGYLESNFPLRLYLR